jgi:hypothetical protein
MTIRQHIHTLRVTALQPIRLKGVELFLGFIDHPWKGKSQPHLSDRAITTLGTGQTAGSIMPGLWCLDGVSQPVADHPLIQKGESGRLVLDTLNLCDTEMQSLEIAGLVRIERETHQPPVLAD